MAISSIDGLFQGIDGAVDEAGPVIGGDDPDSGRKSHFQICQLVFDPLDDVPGILPKAHHHDAAHHFSLAVGFRQAPAHLRAQTD